LDFRQLFKLRLVVAALGETQRLGWWNSGVLTGTGEFLFQQGFPRSAPFAQTRAGFRVAQLACDEALAIQPTPGGPITCHLFRLTPQLEDAFENERNLLSFLLSVVDEAGPSSVRGAHSIDLTVRFD